MADAKPDRASEEDNMQSTLEGQSQTVCNGTAQNVHVVMPRKISDSESTRGESRKNMACPKVNCPEKIVRLHKLLGLNY